MDCQRLGFGVFQSGPQRDVALWDEAGQNMADLLRTGEMTSSCLKRLNTLGD